jgi:hypothetical protein
MVDHVLRGRGLVIDIAGVDIGSVIEEKRGDLGRSGEVERRLAIAPPGMHHRWVGGYEFAEAVQHAEAGGGVRVHGGAALNQVGLEAGGVVENAETAGPPMAAGVNIGAVRKQDVDQVAVAHTQGLQQRGGSEGTVGQRVIEAGLQIGKFGEKTVGRGGIAGAHGIGQQSESVGRFL